MNRLSIIIPVYNVEQYLDQCINSLICELEPQDEIILINDGSKDASLDICKKYQADNVIVLDNSNHGVSYSRNCGIEASKGDYLTFVDADDYLLPGWRIKFGQGMDSGKDIIYFSVSGIEGENREDIARNILCLSGGKRIDIKGSACWNKLFRTEFVRSNHVRFDTEMINGEDGIFSLQCFFRSRSYFIVKTEPLYFYRINNASATHTFNPRFNISNIKFLKTVREELLTSDIFDEVETNEILEYLTFNGLYILATRISYINREVDRIKFYGSFESDFYCEFWRTFDPQKYRGFRVKIIGLLKAKKYQKAMKTIRRRSYIFNMAKRVLGGKNGF